MADRELKLLKKVSKHTKKKQPQPKTAPTNTRQRTMDDDSASAPPAAASPVASPAPKKKKKQVKTMNVAPVRALTSLGGQGASSGKGKGKGKQRIKQVARKASSASSGGKRPYMFNRKPNTKKQQDRTALKQIRQYQKTTDVLLKRAPFRRLVREIAQDVSKFKDDLRMQPEALEALREAAGTYLQTWFTKLAGHAYSDKRVTIMLKDARIIEWLSGVDANGTKQFRDLNPL